MSRYLKRNLSILHLGWVVSFLVLVTKAAPAQSAPVSPNHPWHELKEEEMATDARNLQTLTVNMDADKTYSLTDLIDLAEVHNPATRVSWERARAQAANLGVARSELYPVLVAAALSQTNRSEAFFGSRFNGQVVQDFQAQLDLNYTILDFGARSGRIDSAKAHVLAANFAFNDTHRNVIFQVQQAYYRLLSSIGQEDAARASLSNARAVQEAAEQRLTHGLATRPDVLEARSATAQAEYELQALVGAEEIARGDLATALGTSPTSQIRVQPLDQIPTPDSVADSFDQAISRALGQRPDLLQQVAEIRSANARVKEERASYYPALNVGVSSAFPVIYGTQSPYAWSRTADVVGGVRFNLRWTIFDGGARKSRLAQSQADVHTAQAQANLKRNQIADEVWTAYSNLNTAFRQRLAAVALLESASQSYNAALESYDFGVRNLLDVTAAQRTLAQARSADVLARTQVLTALADLAFKTGDSIRANARRNP